jgi:hypothetical protein
LAASRFRFLAIRGTDEQLCGATSPVKRAGSPTKNHGFLLLHTTLNEGNTLILFVWFCCFAKWSLFLNPPSKIIKNLVGPDSQA